MIPTPKWLEEVPQAEKRAALRRFLIRVAALYASQGGHYTILSTKAGLSNPNSLSMYMGLSEKRRMTKRLAEGVERATGGVITAESLRNGEE